MLKRIEMAIKKREGHIKKYYAKNTTINTEHSLYVINVIIFENIFLFLLICTRLCSITFKESSLYNRVITQGFFLVSFMINNEINNKRQ